MEKYNALKSLNFSVEDVAQVADFFTIIHHANGRIRLRASNKLIKLLLNLQNSSKNEQDLAHAKNLDFEALLEELKNLPFIKNIKINKIIASITIEYDANAFTPSLWELWLVKKDSEKIYAKMQEILRNL